MLSPSSTARSYLKSMTETYFKAIDAKTVDEKKPKASDDRRYRNIIANSGLEMESGEVRQLDSLYVMGRTGRLQLISELDKNPDNQKEKYKVNLATNHGHNDIATGERVVDVEDIIGDAKVWLEEDGLHARIYFANNDAKADHAFAVSDNASYSIGTEWYPEGYYGAGQEIEGLVGILREISMVDTGNDPRAYTLDHKSDSAKAQGSIEEADGNNESNLKGDSEMSEVEIKKADELTPDENRAIKEALAEVVDHFTTDVPESETEPTAREEAKDSEEAPVEAPAETEAPATEEPAEEKKDVLHNNIIVIKDRTVKQEQAVETTVDKKAVVAKAIKASDGKFSAKFADGIAGLADPLNIESMFTSAIEKNDGIINYFRRANVRGLSNNVLAGATDEGGRAKGHKKGENKVDQELNATIRTVYCKMVYKKLSLDAMEVYENPELIQFRAQELVDAIITEIERAAIIGDGREGGSPDLRMFDAENNRGFFSIKADAAAGTGYGSLVASTYTGAEGNNLYDNVVGARGLLMANGEQILIVKPSVLSAAFQAKVGSNYLIAPGATAEEIFRVARVFAPQWMENDDTNDAYLLARNAYTMIGEGNIRSRADFDVNTNQDILLDETPRGGQLTAYKGAVAIKSAA